MTFLFFLFVALVIFHFIYDGIIAPSLRYEIRLQLFEMRDKVRSLKIEHGNQFNDFLFEELQSDINKQIRYLHNITVFGVFETIRLLKDNKEVENKAYEFEKLIYECELTEVKIIYDQSAKKFALAFIANAGGWVIYTIPFVFLLLAGVIAISKVSRFINKILHLPDDELNDALAYRV